MIYAYNFTVNSHSCDYNGIARPTAVMTFLQEAVNLQIEKFGPTDREMREAGRIFVLSRIGVAQYQPIYAYENLRAETWAVPSRGYSFLRCYRLYRGDTLITEASTVWAYVEMQTRHPLRVEEYVPNFTTEPLSDFGAPERIRMPHGELPLLGKYTVRYADTDRNGHMNNTIYADMLCGFLDLRGKRVSQFSINYMNEAPYGDALTVYGTKGESGEHLFRTLRADGKTNIEASFTLTDL